MDLQHIIALGIFLAFVLAALAADLFLLHRKPHAIDLREAALGTLLPVGLAILFAAGLFWAYNAHFLDLGKFPPGIRHTHAEKYYPDTGPEAALLFLTGYLVEFSLSADNIFLFILLMSFFKVSRELQHRVLFLGVLGALLMRGILIALGAALIVRFQWVIYIFGAFLIFTAFKMLLSKGPPSDPSKTLPVRIVTRLIPIHPAFDGKRFFTRKNGLLMGTTLLLVLICIEFTDLVFALDSIPAIFGITRDPFIVFTSNVFAILGLRSMYFLLAGIMDRFHYLKFGIGAVLAFVGARMLLPGLGDLYGYLAGREYHWDIDKYLSLIVIISALAASILASLLFPPKPTPPIPWKITTATQR